MQIHSHEARNARRSSHAHRESPQLHAVFADIGAMGMLLRDWERPIVRLASSSESRWLTNAGDFDAASPPPIRSTCSRLAPLLGIDGPRVVIGIVPAPPRGDAAALQVGRLGDRPQLGLGIRQGGQIRHPEASTGPMDRKIFHHPRCDDVFGNRTASLVHRRATTVFDFFDGTSDAERRNRRARHRAFRRVRSACSFRRRFGVRLVFNIGLGVWRG